MAESSDYRFQRINAADKLDIMLQKNEFISQNILSNYKLQ